MKDLLALKSLFVVAALLAAVLLALWALISSGATTFLVPPPEGVSEQFLVALEGHNYQAARHELSEELQRQVSEADLQALARALEQTQGGIADAHGQEHQIQLQTARATVSVKLGNGREQLLEFPLEQEHGLWKIASLDPLRALEAG